MKVLKILALSLVIALFALPAFSTPAVAQIATNTPIATPQATAAATEPVAVIVALPGQAPSTDLASLPATDQLPPTLGGFLTFLGTVGAIGAVISWVSENWAFFQAQAAQGKMLILLIISTVMGLISMFAVEYIPAGVIAEAEPYYRIFVSSISIVLSSQVYHRVAHADRPIVVKTETVTTSSSISKAVGAQPTQPGAVVLPGLIVQPDGTLALPGMGKTPGQPPVPPGAVPPGWIVNPDGTVSPPLGLAAKDKPGSVPPELPVEGYEAVTGLEDTGDESALPLPLGLDALGLDPQGQAKDDA